MASSIIAAVGLGSNASNSRNEQRHQRVMGELNELLGEKQATDALARGEESVQRTVATKNQTIGSQRARLAAQGIDINSGSAKQLQDDAAAFSAMDVLTIRNNAAREAWGYKTQALGYQVRGNQLSIEANNRLKGTALTQGAKIGERVSDRFRNRPTDTTNSIPVDYGSWDDPAD